MGVEIKQMLERDYDITMDAKNIRSLTFPQLDALSSGKSQSSDAQGVTTETGSVTSPSAPVIRYQLKHFSPDEQLIKLNNIDNASGTPVFVVSPIDGCVLLLERVVSQLKAPVYGLQCTQQTPLTSITDVALEYIRVMLFSIIICIYCLVVEYASYGQV